MKTWIPRIIRYALTIVVLYLVYGETGPWTTFILFGLIACSEIQVLQNDAQRKIDKLQIAYITQIRKVLTKMGAKV